MLSLKSKIVRKSAQRGFTLVELIAVMIILGLLGGVVTIGINSQVKKAKTRAASTQISSFEQVISTFHLECGFYPSSLDDLIKPPSSGKTCKDFPAEGFMSKKEIPSDPWNEPYNYSMPGEHNTDSYDLWSKGPDGEDGTSDDIKSWTSEQSDTEK